MRRAKERQFLNIPTAFIPALNFHNFSTFQQKLRSDRNIPTLPLFNLPTKVI
jgi:hypothetical protein